MNLELNVVANGDNTHTVSWIAERTSPESKLHTLTVGLSIGTWLNPDGTIGSDNRGVFSWHHQANANIEPQLIGEITMNFEDWYPDWTQVSVTGNMAEFETPESDADDYDSHTAVPISVTRTTITRFQAMPPPTKGKGKGKNK